VIELTGQTKVFASRIYASRFAQVAHEVGYPLRGSVGQPAEIFMAS